MMRKLIAAAPMAGCLILAASLVSLNYFVTPSTISAGPDAGSVVLAIGVGAASAQLVLVAIWVVFSAQPLFLRVAISALAMGVSHRAFFEGLATLDGSDYALERAPIYLISLTLVFVAVQLPLWPMRVWLSWAIARPLRPLPGSYRSAMGLRDLAGTVVVLAALVAFRSTIEIDPLAPPNLLTVTALFCGLFTAASLFIVPVLLFAWLGRQRPGRRWAALSVGSMILTLALLGLVWVLIGIFPVPRRPALTRSMIGVASFVVIASVGLILSRAAGYRLLNHRVLSHGRGIRGEIGAPDLTGERPGCYKRRGAAWVENLSPSGPSGE